MNLVTAGLDGDIRRLRLCRAVFPHLRIEDRHIPPGIGRDHGALRFPVICRFEGRLIHRQARVVRDFSRRWLLVAAADRHIHLTGDNLIVALLLRRKGIGVLAAHRRLAVPPGKLAFHGLPCVRVHIGTADLRFIETLSRLYRRGGYPLQSRLRLADVRLERQCSWGKDVLPAFILNRDVLAPDACLPVPSEVPGISGAEDIRELHSLQDITASLDRAGDARRIHGLAVGLRDGRVRLGLHGDGLSLECQRKVHGPAYAALLLHENQVAILRDISRGQTLLHRDGQRHLLTRLDFTGADAVGGASRTPAEVEVLHGRAADGDVDVLPFPIFRNCIAGVLKVQRDGLHLGCLAVGERPQRNLLVLLVLADVLPVKGITCIFVMHDDLVQPPLPVLRPWIIWVHRRAAYLPWRLRERSAWKQRYDHGQCQQDGQYSLTFRSIHSSSPVPAADRAAAKDNGFIRIVPCAALRRNLFRT